MIKKPSVRIAITLFNNIEKAMAKENYDKIIRNCEVFLALVKSYKKQHNSLNKERR